MTLARPAAFGLSVPLALPLVNITGRVGYAVETTALLAQWAALGTKATARRADALDRKFVRPLKDASLWTRMDAIWTPQHSAAAAVINPFDPTGSGLALVDTPTIVADRHFQGNGTSSYFNSQINPSLGGRKFALDDASLFVWSLTESQTSAFDAGSGNASRLRLRSVSGNLMGAGANTATFETTSMTSSVGFGGWSRRSSTGFDFFKGASVIDTKTAASSAIPNANVHFAANAGTSWSPRQYVVFGLGAGLTAQNISDLHSILTGWLTELGAI